jgi:hypothetical protein
MLSKIRDLTNEPSDKSGDETFVSGGNRRSGNLLRGVKRAGRWLIHNDARPQLYPDTIADYRNLFFIIFGMMILTYVFGIVAYAVQSDTFPSPFYAMWGQYDTNHYINIAKLGYGTGVDQRVLIVFFPLYPALIKLLYFPLHFIISILLNINSVDEYLVSALIISNVSYIVAAFYLFKLARIDYSKDVAFRAVFYFMIFPTAYFMHAAYTESLFLALALVSFYYARKNNWLVACIAGCFLTATRMTGVFIIPALVFEYLQQRDWKFTKIDRKSLFLFMVPIGVLSFLAINFFVNHDPFSFLPLEKEVWNKSIENPLKGFVLALGWFGDWVTPEQRVIVGFAETGAGVIGLVFVLALILKYRPMYATFVSLSWLLATATEFWLSIPRYLLSMFPIFIVLANWGKNKAVDYLVTFFCVSMYIIFMTHFTQSRWAF